MISLPANVKLSTKKKANIATHNLPITADGTRSLSLAYLAKVALQARPVSYTHLTLPTNREV